MGMRSDCKDHKSLGGLFFFNLYFLFNNLVVTVVCGSSWSIVRSGLCMVLEPKDSVSS